MFDVKKIEHERSFMEKIYFKPATQKVAQVKQETIDFLLQYSRVLRQIKSTNGLLLPVEHCVH